MSKFRLFKHFVLFQSQFFSIFLVSVFNLFWNHSMSRWLFTYTSKATWNCLGNITGLFSILFFYSATFLGGFSLTHITYSIFLFVKWREEKKVKFPLWAVSMLGCSWPRTFRNFSIKEGGTTCSKWASYLSILRSLSYATMASKVLWSCNADGGHTACTGF